MSPDLHKLEHFVAVAEELNFTRAADRLHMAQQALSASIRRLEQELGVQLFVRSTRQVVLTRAGEQLLLEGRGLLVASRTTWENVRRVDRGQRRLVRAAHTPSVPREQLEDFIAAWRVGEPDVALAVDQVMPDALAADIADGKIDIGVCRVLEPPSGVVVAQLGERPLRLAVAARHRLARRPAVPLAELARETIVDCELRGAGPPPGDFVVELCRGAGFEPRVTPPAVEGVPPLAAVAGSDDVALVDAPPGAAAGGRVVVRDLVPVPVLPVHAVTRRGAVDPLIARLVEAATACMAAAAFPVAPAASPVTTLRRTRAAH